VSPSAWRYTLRRIFTNGTASAMIVRETGIYYNDVQNNLKFMLARDLVDSSGSALGLTVASGGALEIKYNFYVDGSNGLTLNFLKAVWNAMTYQSAGGYQLPTIYNTEWAESATGAWNKDFNWQSGNIMPVWRLFQGGGNWYGVDMGIVVGVCAYPFAIWNNRLGQQLWAASGASASPVGTSILYDNMIWMSPTGNSWSSVSWSFYRTVTNNPPVPNTIREVGLVSAGDCIDYKTGNEFLWFRQVTPDIVLSATQSTMVKITFTTTC
jgi:hypothetical protein